MKRKGLRYLFASAIITTALSLLIGGFATISVKNSQIAVIDSQLNTIAASVRQNPSAPVSAALDSAAEQDFNVTIALVSASGDLTIVNESQLNLRNPPTESVIINSLQTYTHFVFFIMCFPYKYHCLFAHFLDFLHESLNLYKIILDLLDPLGLLNGVFIVVFVDPHEYLVFKLQYIVQYER